MAAFVATGRAIIFNFTARTISVSHGRRMCPRPEDLATQQSGKRTLTTTPDLLIANYDPKVGRCTLPVTLSFLLFDAHGRPVPWTIDTEAPSLDLPAAFVDVNHDGRPKLVTTECAYYNSTGNDGAILRVTGIYAAKEAMWSGLIPEKMDAYRTLASQIYSMSKADVGAPLKTDWMGSGNQMKSLAEPVEIAAILKRSDDCRGVNLPIVNGRLERSGDCGELRRNRFQLTNGTICYDWPAVVFDDENGRKIIMDEPESSLQEIAARHRKIVLVGQRDPHRCSPVLMQADAPTLANN